MLTNFDGFVRINNKSKGSCGLDQVNITKTPMWELRVRGALKKLSSSESRVAEYVLRSPNAVFGSNIRQLAESCSVSESTVVRFLRRTGFDGLKDFKTAMTQGRVLDGEPAARVSRKLDDSDTIRAIKTKVFYGCIEALSDTMDVLDDRALSRAIEALDAAPYVEVFGLGGSASAARSALHCFRKIGLRVNATSELNFTYLRMERFNPGDVVLAISRSGETSEVVDAVRIAREKGAFIVSITNVQESTLSKLSDCCLTSMCRSHMMPGDETYERVAQIAVIRALYAGVAMRRGEERERLL